MHWKRVVGVVLLLTAPISWFNVGKLVHIYFHVLAAPVWGEAEGFALGRIVGAALWATLFTGFAVYMTFIAGVKAYAEEDEDAAWRVAEARLQRTAKDGGPGSAESDQGDS